MLLLESELLVRMYRQGFVGDLLGLGVGNIGNIRYVSLAGTLLGGVSYVVC